MGVKFSIYISDVHFFFSLFIILISQSHVFSYMMINACGGCCCSCCCWRLVLVFHLDAGRWLISCFLLLLSFFLSLHFRLLLLWLFSVCVAKVFHCGPKDHWTVVDRIDRRAYVHSVKWCCLRPLPILRRCRCHSFHHHHQYYYRRRRLRDPPQHQWIHR